MLELGIGAELVRGAGWVIRLLFLAALGYALWRGKNWKQRMAYALLVIGVFLGPLLPSAYQAWQYKQRYAKAKAIFDERCKNAGEIIYRTVDDVEGVLLINPPPMPRVLQWGDPNWPDAGLPRQNGGNDLIVNLLEYFKRDDHGYSFSDEFKPDHNPGYRFIDAMDQNGKTWRYSLGKVGNRETSVPVSDRMKKTDHIDKPALYAVTYKNLINPADRELWVAGTTLIVTEIQSGEILAQSTWYSMEPGLGSRSGHRTPWLFAVSCPELVSLNAAMPTRFFIEKVLRPQKGEFK
ncbi:MAG: hypothetical protein Q4G70_12725 [Pseudomonadota bacterium]|nr:hypothetical protein [Pseudomonadota bacterium]